MKTQYRIIAAAAGYADCSDRGRIRLTGPDSRSFLQALLSNDVASLPAGSGVYATYLTPQGRMIADLGERTDTIFRRFRVEGVGQKRIAEELGISINTVEKHLQRAYRALVGLRRRLDDAEVSPADERSRSQ